ncbi:MAG: signal peptidase II [Arhodomonas sp.]|nr:signal peptidase II [Arhodomonas sp.]
MLRFGLIVAALVLLADQATKAWAVSVLTAYRPEPVLPFLNWTLSYNPGAAFSFLADHGGWQRWLFTGLALAVSGYLVWWLHRLPRGERLVAGALALILGGALGNVIDRLRLGYVVDFVDLHAGGWHWPAFNIADSAITLGVAALILAALLGRRL